MPVCDELEGGARLQDGHGRSAPAAGTASRRSPRSVPADVRDRRHGEAGAVGQGVQPQPREARPPQRAAERSGGAAHRGEATAEQAPPGAVRWVGGEAPPAERSAATPAGPAPRAGRARRARGHRVQRCAAGQAKGRRSRTEAQPPGGVAALCAAGPQGRRSRPLEAEGREGIGQLAGAAFSRASAGEAALAAVPKARPARCQMVGAWARAISFDFVLPVGSRFGPARRNGPETRHERACA